MPIRKPLVCAALGGLVIAAAAFGHRDDPKAFGAAPIYEGPGFRAGANPAPPPGGGGFDAVNVNLLSWIPIGEFPGGEDTGTSNDCWGYVSPSGREYAIYGLRCGTGFVEITDPANPVVLDYDADAGLTVIPNACSTWHDIKTYDEYAYIVTDNAGNEGIQVIDLTLIDDGILTKMPTINDGGFESHNVVVNEDSGYLYRTGGSGNGLLIYDLANPAQPALVAEWTDRYIHDAQVVTFDCGPYEGREIAFCCSGFSGGWVEPGLDILDVTDKTDIIALSRILYPDAAYSHQGWLSADGTMFYLGDELDEDTFEISSTTHIIDVSDLNEPFVANVYDNGNPAITHNLYTRGDYVFAANYSSGLRIYDASQPADLVEVGYFDTRPEDDGVEYNGLWSTFVDFPSGVVIGSDRQRGLFVWSVDLPEPLLGDLDGNSVVDFQDLLALLSQWGDCVDSPECNDCPGDLNGNGSIEFGDLLIMLSNWSA